MNQNFPPSAFRLHPCFSAPPGQLWRELASVGEPLKRGVS